MAALLRKIGKALRFLWVTPSELAYWRAARQSGLFDVGFYRATNLLNPLFHAFPLRHYIVFGEAANLRPNPAFSPRAYRRHNRDLGGLEARPFEHFIRIGRDAALRTTDQSAGEAGLALTLPPLPGRPEPPQDYAIALHLYYPELWGEFAAGLGAVDIGFDLYVTLTDRGAQTATLADQIRAEFPAAVVLVMPNHGRDVFPFLWLVNAGLFAGYRAVCKLHSKRSEHRDDGDHWRRALVAGVLPGASTGAQLARFLDDDGAMLWVADGYCYDDLRWWGANEAATRGILGRIGVKIDAAGLSFPAGSIYWLKPSLIRRMRDLELTWRAFEPEYGQVDGTLAHGFERAVGYLAAAAGGAVRQSGELEKPLKPAANLPR